tara:strand:- start:3 stop:269 length:267 start_codon:yes stop_codon:yes gene_type:complete
MEKISLSRFKKDTYHKRVVYDFVPNKENMPSKHFETDKFYCNSFGKGNFKMLSLPKFCLSREIELFKIAENNFLAISEYGKTNFVVVV